MVKRTHKEKRRRQGEQFPNKEGEKMEKEEGGAPPAEEESRGEEGVRGVGGRGGGRRRRRALLLYLCMSNHEIGCQCVDEGER